MLNKRAVLLEQADGWLQRSLGCFAVPKTQIIEAAIEAGYASVINEVFDRSHLENVIRVDDAAKVVCIAQEGFIRRSYNDAMADHNSPLPVEPEWIAA